MNTFVQHVFQDSYRGSLSSTFSRTDPEDLCPLVSFPFPDPSSPIPPFLLNLQR